MDSKTSHPRQAVVFPRVLVKTVVDSILVVLMLGIALRVPVAQVWAQPAQGMAQEMASNTSHQARLSLQKVVAVTLQKHPMQSLGDSRKALGQAYRQQSAALFAADPSYNLSYRTDQMDSDTGYREFEGSLDFPLWRKGQKSSRRKLASSIESGVDSQQSLLRWQIAGEVMERAWALRIALMEVGQAKARQQAVKQLESDVAKRVQAGELARSDLLLAQQNSGEASMNLLQAMKNQQVAQTAWQSYTGYSALPHDLDKAYLNKKTDFTKHPQLLAASAQVATAKAGRDDLRASRYENPTLSVFAKRDRGSDSDPYNNSLGVGISVPFGSQAHSMPQLAEANSAVAEAVASEALLKRELQQQIKLAQESLQAAQQALGQSNRQNQLAQKRWKLARRAFDLGEGDLYPLILAREQADQQSYSEQKSRLELGLAKSRLQHIQGVTP